MKILSMVAAFVVSVSPITYGLTGAAETSLPLTKVTTFSSGVAFYEHNGQVKNNANVLLKFKADQINDVLKSLVLMDLGGGEIGEVTYVSREPLARALKNFGVDISGEPTLGQLLRQIRGTEVVVMAPDKISGKILGVETKTEHVLPSNTIIHQEILNLLTTEGVKSIALETIGNIEFTSEKLNSELNKALNLLVESRDTNRKSVQVSFRGKDERAVRLCYINEAPVWKTSYRLVFGGKEENKALMQGWAIVENTSDLDWENVELTFVSGRPISFIQDLYTPLYVSRPVVVPELYTSLRPHIYEEGIESAKEAKYIEARKVRSGAFMDMAEKASATGQETAEYYGRGVKGRVDMEEELAAVKSAAAGEAVGELFSYRVKNPVTLPRSKSAMLPIINQDVEARKVSIYNASVLVKNPLNGFWLTNDTNLSLLAGPVTVFDEGTYAGDTQISNLSPNDKRLLSYAIDLKVRVDSSQKSSHRIVAAKISRGVLEVSRRYEYRQEYVLKNKADQERSIVIEHPRQANLKLIKPAVPLEKTENLYRFEVAVPASETGKFEVIEEKFDMQTIAILPGNVDSLLWYSKSDEIPEKVRDALSKAIEMKNALSQAERELDELQQQVRTLREEQSHIRKNMGAVKRGDQAYNRFEKKLLDLETKIEALQDKIEDKRNQVERLRKKLADHISGLSVD